MTRPEKQALKDQEARNRIRSDLKSSFVVEAAAGTGKTTQLVQRIVSLIQTGETELSRIVALTFTEKAAGEMKLRLRGELEHRLRAKQALTKAEGKQLNLAISELETAHISTIHSFCADILKERPVEAGVDPEFQVLDGEASRAQLEEVFSEWYERALQEPPEAIRRFLARAAAHEDPRGQLLSAAHALVEQRDFRAAWKRPELKRASALRSALAELSETASLIETANFPDARANRGLRSLWLSVNQMKQESAASSAGSEEARLDNLEVGLTKLLNAKIPGENKRIWEAPKGSGAFSEALSYAQLSERILNAETSLKQLSSQLDADLAASLQRALWPIVDAYCERLSRLGALDFLDLLERTRGLLTRDQEVRAELIERFSHLFVDEFQDTDPLQAAILLLLSSADASQADPAQVKPTPGKLFVVGDPKQAIYRFRRADIALYERVKQQLLKHGAERLTLTTNFRSTEAIQRLVNLSFSEQMQGGVQPEYVPLSPFRENLGTQPSLVVLPVPNPYPDWVDRPRPTLGAIDKSYPDAVAAYIDWLVHESGWQVRDGDGLRNISTGDICCLFRRFQSYYADITRPYVRALEARELPHVLVGGRSFHGREEVQALRTALSAIEWPGDELSVYATLRGTLFGFSDADLLEFKYLLGKLDRGALEHTSAEDEAERLAQLNPLRPIDRSGLPNHLIELADALSLLAHLHYERNRRPIAETINQLLADTRAHAGIAIWPSGEQALANVLQLVSQARRYEARGAISFRGFVEWLMRQASQGTSSEAPVIEEGAEGVRLMTIHGAKGLEFPVVILCDPGAALETAHPSRFIDAEAQLWAQRLCGLTPHELLEHGSAIKQQDDAEVVRLAYVAATRAMDLLVLPGIGDGPFPSVERWTKLFHSAIYPAKTARRNGRASAACPSFGEDSVCARPFSADEVTPVRPGLYEELANGAGVIWWDPNTLQLNRTEYGGVRQQHILEAKGRWDAARLNHEAWRKQLDTSIEGGARIELLPRSVTEVAHALEGGFNPTPLKTSGDSQSLVQPLPEWLEPHLETLQVQRLERSPGRPSGARFGSLVHGLLERVPTLADPDHRLLPDLARQLGEQLGCPQNEIHAALSAARMALRSPLLARAAGALEIQRECPLSYLTPAGEVWEGVVDLAFREETGWWVVDFKTDALSPPPSAYKIQLAIYCHALELASGLPCTGVLLGV